MSRDVVLTTVALLSLGFAPAPKSDELAEKVRKAYASLGGMWRAADDRPPLNYFWLHAGEKAVLAPGEKWTMRLALAFDGKPKPRERFNGKPARVELDGGAMKLVLPPPDKESKHTVRSVRIHKVGDKLHLQVIGGPYEGKYVLKKAPSKF